MSLSAPRLSALSDDEKETVCSTLKDHGLKIYTAAMVSLSDIGVSRDLATSSIQGALVLSRSSTGQLSLYLIDVSNTAGSISWCHELTKTASLTEAKESNEERTYTLSDVGLRRICVFADDVEASKLITKCSRAVARNEFYEQTITAGIEQLDLDDGTIRGITIQGSARISRAIGQKTDRGNATSTGQTRIGLGSELPAEPPTFWKCEVNGRVYQIPDLTASLFELPPNEVNPREVRKGGFGSVRHARLNNNKDVAVKSILAPTRSRTGRPGPVHETKRFRNEVVKQSELNHPNVLPLLGIAIEKASASLVLPWMKNSDSRQYVNANPNVRRLPLVYGAICGIEYLHSQGIVHGDIKGRNILISDDGQPLLSDFGMTTCVSVDDRDLSRSVAEAGSAQWMATELLRSAKPGKDVTKYSDMWAFSMTVIELITGSPPFTNRDLDCHEAIRNHQLERFPKKPDSAECSGILWELVTKCWELQPTSRPTAEKARCVIEGNASSGSSL